MKFKYFLAFLALVAATVWLAVWVYPEPKLHLIACDVGQGDAILATYGQTQILIDGGPDRKVLDCLAKYLPFWDRELEIVLLTHPQKDHFGGLIDVFGRYSVQVFMANALDSSSQEYEVLKSKVGGSGTRIINPTQGMSIRSGAIYLDIVHPSREYILSNSEGLGLDLSKNVLGSYTSSASANDFSITAILSLGEFDALLTGDIMPKISNQLSTNQLIREVEYIKIPHHGSKNGLTEDLLKVTNPEVAVISAGKKNRYGHPHKEVIKLLSDRDIKILRTDDVGDIEIVSDGNKWWVVE
jgi:competence protein ComEC